MLVSIIVPIYNTEKYLTRCINSIIEQSYENLEIILVNDGSTDESKIVCERYLNLDTRIRLINKTNGGLSDSRNFGIEASNGNFLCFIDSDDFIHKNFIEYQLNVVKKNNLDICFCYREKGRKNQFSEKNIYNENSYEIINKKNLFDKYYSFSYSACTGIFSRNIIADVRFPLGILHEDQATIYKFILNSNSIGITRNKLYYVYLSPGSITRSEYTLKRTDEVRELKKKIEFLYDSGYENLLGNVKVHYFEVLVNHKYLINKYFPNEKNLKQHINLEIMKIKKEVLIYLFKMFKVKKMIKVCILILFPRFDIIRRKIRSG